MGITLLPRLAVEAGIAEGHDIALVPAPDAAPRKVVMIWRRSSARAADFSVWPHGPARGLGAGRPLTRHCLPGVTVFMAPVVGSIVT